MATVTEALVTLTVEIPIQGRWGDQDSVGFIREQAVESAKQTLRNGVTIDGVNRPGNANTIAKMLGEPQVKVTIHAPDGG